MADNGMFQHPGVNVLFDMAQQAAAARARSRGGSPLMQPEYIPGQDMAQAFLEQNMLRQTRSSATSSFTAQNNFMVDASIQALRSRGFSGEARALERAVKNNVAGDILGQMMNVHPIVQGAFGGNVLGAHMNAINAGGSFAGGMGMAGSYRDVLSRQTAGIRNASEMASVIAATALRTPGGGLRGIPDARITGGYTVEQTMNAMTTLQAMGANTGMGMLHTMPNATAHIQNQTAYAMGLMRDIAPYGGGRTPEDAMGALRAHAGNAADWRAAWNPASGLGDIYRSEIAQLQGLGVGIGRGPGGLQGAFNAGRWGAEVLYGPAMAGSEYGRAQGMQAARNVAARVAYITNQGGTVGVEEMQELENAEGSRQLRQQNQSGTRNVTAAALVLAEDPELEAAYGPALADAVSSGDPRRVRSVTRKISGARFGDEGAIGKMARDQEAYADFHASVTERLKNKPGGQERLSRIMTGVAGMNDTGERAEAQRRQKRLEISETLGAQRRGMANAGLRYDEQAGSELQLDMLMGSDEARAAGINLNASQQARAREEFRAAKGGKAGMAAVQRYLHGIAPEMDDAVKEVLGAGEAFARREQGFKAGKEGRLGDMKWNTRAIDVLNASSKDMTDTQKEQFEKAKHSTDAVEKTRILEGLMNDPKLVDEDTRNRLLGDLATGRKNVMKDLTEVKSVAGGTVRPGKLTGVLGDLERRKGSLTAAGGTEAEAEMVNKGLRTAEEQQDFGRVLTSRGKRLERAAEELLKGGDAGELTEKWNAKLDPRVTKITEKEIQAKADDLKKKTKETETASTVKSAKALGVTVVELAPGTELTIIDGKSRRKAVTGGTESGTNYGVA